MNHRIFERKLRSRGLTPREHVRLSAASIYPFNKSHSTHRAWWNWGNGLYHRRRRWHGLRLCMVILCPNTHRYMHIIVCEALMCCRCRCWSVGWSCVCFVYGVVVVAHTPGIAVCAAALPCWLPPFIGRRLHGACTLNSIMPCLCAWTRSHIYLVCVSRTHTHATPNPLQHPHTHAYEQSRMHSKGNMYIV